MTVIDFHKRGAALDGLGSMTNVCLNLCLQNAILKAGNHLKAINVSRRFDWLNLMILGDV